MPRFAFSEEDENADVGSPSFSSPLYSLRRPSPSQTTPVSLTNNTTAGLSFSPNTPLQQQQQEDSDPYSSATGATPPSKPPAPSHSVNLSFRSPEGRQWHSLVRTKHSTTNKEKYVIWSRRCPDETDQHRSSSSSGMMIPPPLIETILPATIQKTLAVDPPLAMICIAAEGSDLAKLPTISSRTNSNSNTRITLIGLPRLCIYTATAAFVIQAGFDPYAAAEQQDTQAHRYGAVPGMVVAVQEPLERYLLQCQQQQRILRIRPAPQRYLGNAVHSPAGAMLVLTHDTHHQNEYHLVSVEHTSRLKEPVCSVRVEAEMEENRIVDFCFGQSQGLALLSSMSVLLLQASGNVLAASPFVFDGTLVPRAILQESLDFLQTGLERMDRTQPQWRQYRAAECFVREVFAPTSQHAHFVTARVAASTASRDTATLFPVQLQGPILFQTDDADNNQDSQQQQHDHQAVTIEPFGSSDLVGFCVATQSGRVDFGITAPTTILPRFALESRNDTYALDDQVFQHSAWVERLDLDLETKTSDAVNHYYSSSKIPGSLALLKDPNLDSVMHVVTPSLVASISTNTVRAASVLVREGQSRMEPSTHVWSYLEQTSSSSPSFSVKGVVALADELSGHKLIVQMSQCDNIQEFNVSEEKATQEMHAIMANSSPQKSSRALLLLEGPGTPATETAQATLRNLEAIPPFHQTAMPHVEKVNRGLAKMAKLVGSDTKYTEITPDILAVAAAIQQRCEEEVVVPAMELASVTKTRRTALQKVIEEQTAQIQTLLKMRDEMEARNAKLQASLAAAEENAQTLRERTAAARDKCNALVPTVTEAERAYFQFVEAVQIKSEKWEAQVQETTKTIREQCAKWNAHSPVLTSNMLDETLSANMGKIHADTERKLVNTRQTLKETEQRLHAILRRAGLEAPSENVPANVMDNPAN